MTREEKEEILRAAFAGNTEPLRRYRQQFERVSGTVIYEFPPSQQRADNRVCWWRPDGTPVIELVEEFEKRQKDSYIALPDNGRDGLFK